MDGSSNQDLSLTAYRDPVVRVRYCPTTTASTSTLVRHHATLLSSGQGSNLVLPFYDPIHIPTRVNDFAMRRHSVLFAADTATTTTTTTRQQVTACLWKKQHDSTSHVAHRVRVDKLPQSSALTIEQSNEIFFLGHRNGQVTLYDDRTSVICQSTRPASSFVSLIQVLQGGNLLATRSQLCSMRLYDVRKFTADCLFELEPGGQECPTSSRCSGLATDPSETVLFSPFLKQQKDTDHDQYQAHIGVWSLYSGEYVGSRPLHTSHSPMVVELNPTRTAAWKKQDSWSRIPGSFGVWYKLIEFKAQDCTGNIHQAVFEGRFS
jgi:hypothetical protein